METNTTEETSERKAYSKEEQKQLIKLLRKGTTGEDAAKALGRPLSGVRNLRKKIVDAVNKIPEEKRPVVPHFARSGGGATLLTEEDLLAEFGEDEDVFGDVDETPAPKAPAKGKGKK